jgi:outer membrane lipoprotein-sorting protein
VGKTTSYVDLVKRVNWAMHDENDAYSVVPETREEIAQYLFLFGMSGNPRDLDHFLDYDQKSADVWLQLSSGDNKSMQSVVSTTEAYIATHPMPAGISRTWAGLTYINTVWQEKMVGGMLGSLAGAFIMVALLMLILFRSLVWALLAMLPLSVTIAFSYGFIGLVGKSYDMPVAVLSALALGLSVDFAIHFIERYRETRMRHRTMEDAMDEMFGESARALAKNALIVSIGFTPLLFAPLIPYITVGVLLASIMALSWATTVLLLPALIKAFNVGEKNSDQRRLQMKKVLLALTLTMFAIPASAWAGNATEIMEKAHLASYYAGDDGKARVHMEIINPDGGKRIREFTILRKDVSEGGDQLFFIYFRKPNDVRDMTFLVKKHPKADDDRWLFIPSIRMVKRIAASDARSAFVGSDYTYEDISGRHPSKDNAELLGEEELNGRKVWVVRNTPKKPVRDYAWRKTYVDQATYLVLKESYYDADGKEVRRFTNDEIKQVDGFWIGVAGTMENLELDHKTTVRFSDVKLNVGIPDRVFTERSLKSAPKKWIR